MPTIQHCMALYLPLHESEPYRDVAVTRDSFYGPHERHRLDVFDPGGAAKPVFVFVHGGGFAAGDKHRPGSPYGDNVPLWAARHGLLGINITYRLAPDSQFPSGAEDVAAAIGWVCRHAEAHGGDPARIFVGGTSAGAAHVAAYLADPAYGARDAVAGAVLLSGLYDMATCERNPRLESYFGSDPSRYPERSNLAGLVECGVPLLVTLAEYDPIDFERQALGFVKAWFARHGEWPNFLRLAGHNHFTTGMHLNTGGEYLGARILDFIRLHSA